MIRRRRRNFIENWKITNYNTLHLNFKLLVIKPLILYTIHFDFKKKVIRILMTTMLAIKILFTINSLKKEEEEKKTYSFKTLLTTPVDLKSI